MKGLQTSLRDLDELDLMLVRELEKNARVSYAILASKLGTSPSTVSRRFNRLVDQGVIAIEAIPAYAALGYRIILLLAINTFPGSVDTLARQLASINSVKYVWVTAGRYDILAIAMYRSTEEYMAAFPKEFSSIPANVNIETMLSLKMIKGNSTHPIYDAIDVDSHSRVRLKELDLSVMRELERSPRVSAKDLSRNIGASLSSVRSSLRKLTSEGTIRVTTTPDPASLGDAIRALTLVQVHPSSLKPLTDKLKTHPSVKHITLTLGAFNCMLGIGFQTQDQLSDFLVHDLGNMPGVVCRENLLELALHKRSFSLLSDNSSAADGSH